MKKILLASTVALSIAGFAKSAVYAEESQVTKKTQTTDVVEKKEESAPNKEESAPKKEVPRVDTRKESVVKEKDPAKEDLSNKEKDRESKKEGWLKEQGSWRFYENNQPVLDWKQIDNKWYYFNKEGVMISNIIIDDYLIQDNGALAENTWVKISDKWYYATASGKILRNKWEKIAGIWYYFDKEGIMVTNTLVGDYLIQNSGALAENTWVKISNKWYYATASGKISRNKWEKIKGIWYYFDTDGVMLSNQWKTDYYLKDSGAMAEKEWIFDNSYNSWFYLKTGGAYASREWSGSYYLKTGGYMAKNEWIFDKDYDAWYYLKEDGMYVTGTFNIKGKEYSFQNNGKWISESKYYKVKPITAYVYSSSGEKLSYVSKGTIVSLGDTQSTKNTQIPVNISGLSGFMNKSDLTAVDEGSEFIPHYTSDGKFLYHELSPYTSIKVAPHTSAMVIGKKYYSTDGEHFDGFTVKNPFLFKNLREPSNYSAAELDKVYSVMNIQNSPLAGKGATFKEAEERYGVNALYLMAHSALESAWGRSQIARDKNNFFGIAAYDTSPYLSAKSFDDVDKGILGAAKWIRENYIDYGRDHLGNKATGMNVRYASDPYWGEKIASIMMTINSRLGGKD
ncbi:glucosaminidase domain-containing protein [Streptococcus oralis]|uniref:Endo-beta-N-acetylglucosaminidase n=1 Tax=Streptococcus oralis subsp. tigurinus TaxID=1077464 RepID=A0A0F2E4V8_STROR|nr:glucosaminidase domain-containing protein [Streptococcus oralis]KJQ76836.1 endo-beta-N-acetylglucosaminidase [Streptococcus oralis subsp. tigurinus]ORO39139.1 endo-beta-N-acetylglucosaminidase [Streptococcus oralis subsp. tigurinus]BBA08754.1 Endo-beta-N-acetylglucosaminidase [Streptococcus oralis subsp. tigurinus]